MKKQVDIVVLVSSVKLNLDSLVDSTRGERGKNRTIKIGRGTYLYRDLRFCVEGGRICEVRYIKTDRDNFLKVYVFGKSRDTKSYFYKTSLLLNGQIENFCNLCLNELENRG